MRNIRSAAVVAVVLLSVVVASCGKKKPPLVAMPAPAPSPAPPPVARGPERIQEPLPVPQQPSIAEDAIGTRSLDDLNRESPFRPAYFELDSADLDAEGQRVVQANAATLKKYTTWAITIEGHCDERGTAEYNLALGERRAMSVKTYLVSLGIAPDRLRVVSYGKEFPFDVAHSDAAWAKNRRAHFVITAR